MMAAHPNLTNFPNCGPGTHCQMGSGAQRIQSVVLPNGTAWTFQWDSSSSGSLAYGDLIGIVFPTGGSIAYKWPLHCPTCGTSARVLTRTVGANDSIGPQTTMYAIGNTIVNSPFATTVTDPLKNDTVHTFTPLGGCSPYETTTQYYQGAASTGVLLKTTQTDYDYTVVNSCAPSAPIDALVINVLPKRVTTTWPNGQVSKIEKDYLFDVTFPSGGTIPTSYGNVVAQREYDYGNGSPGPLLRATNYSFLRQSNTNYQTANLLDYVCLVTVYGSGVVPQQTSCSPPAVQANQVAQTIYGYDESNGSPQGIFGNQTSVTRWLNGGTSPKSQTVFNAQGMPIKKIEPMGNTTQITYDGTGAFPSQIQYPATSGIAHNEGFTYDANTGLLNSHTDQNSQLTSYGYDSMLRQTSITYPPTGGQTTFCYTDEGGPTCAKAAPPFQVVSTKQINANTNLVTVDVFDGLGRPIQTQLTSDADPNGATYVDTSYDALGRVFTKANPHRSAGAPTHGTTKYFYDALGRTCLVVPPDGTQPTGNPCATQPSNDVFTTYSGNTTTVTDQVGITRSSTTDGLGRLVKIVEASTYETDYAYDALDNLTCAAQKGSNTGLFTNCASTPATWRPRSFAYDSLSRLTGSTNPESNTVNLTGATLATIYKYDANANLVSKIAPAQNQTGTSTVTLSYCYDALNRLLSKAYTPQSCPMTSPVATYSYDQGPSGTNPIGHRSGMTDVAGSASWMYDAMGRPYIQNRTTNGITMTTAYTYNLDSSTATLTYPSGRTITYAVGGAGRPLSAIDQDNGVNYALGASYAPQGPLSSLLLGQTGSFGGINLNQSYNSRLQPASIRAFSTSGVALDLAYCFYPMSNGVCPTTGANNGNVRQITNNRDNTRTQTFVYDALNRLSSAQTQTVGVTIPNANCWGLTFGYDSWGNLLSSSATGPTGCGEPMPWSVSAANSNQINGYCYDTAGNLLLQATCPPSNPVYAYTFDAENHLTNTGGFTYIYDGDGNRVEKLNTKLYWYGLDGTVLAESDASGNITDEYVFFDGNRVARQHAAAACPNPSVVSDFYLTDQLGSSRVVTDSSGNLLDDSDFYPFGGERDANSPSSGNNYRFTGKERDSESSLDSFGDRYNSSIIGRFMSPDWSEYPEPVPYAELTDPQSLNLYSYVQNNPVNMVDDDGHDPNAAGTCGFLCRVFNYIFGDGSGNEHVTVTFTPVQYPFPPASSVHADPYPMQPGVNYGTNPPGKYLVGGCPGGTCHTLDGLYPPLERNLHPLPWLLMGLGAFGSASEGLTVEKILSNPNVLKGMGPQEVEELIGNTPGWRVEKLAQGSQKGQGWVLREYSANGNPTGRLIRWHPGGGHHGPTPYWRVSSGTGGKSGIIPGE
jgi:RHS repeat-associated protein